MPAAALRVGQGRSSYCSNSTILRKRRQTKIRHTCGTWHGLYIAGMRVTRYTFARVRVLRRRYEAKKKTFEFFSQMTPGGKSLHIVWKPLQNCFGCPACCKATAAAFAVSASQQQQGCVCGLCSCWWIRAGNVLFLATNLLRISLFFHSCSRY